jgi:hypothetical protein
LIGLEFANQAKAPTMSMAYPQQQSNNKTTLILITLGVVLASIVELIAVGAAYIFIISSIFANQFNKLDQAQAAAREQARQVANRPSPPPNWNPPSSSRPSNSRSSPPEGPGTPYSHINMVGPNDRVYILWRTSWWPGTVVERKGDEVRVHYDNHSNASDEDVGIDRLRRMPRTDPKYHNGDQFASSRSSRPRPSMSPPSTSPPASGGPTTFSNSPPPPAGAPPSPANLNPRELSAPFNSRHQPQDTTVREWRNRNGDVIFRGQLYANFGPAVRLVQRSGFSLHSIPVDVSLLSDEDQAYVKRFPEVSPDRPDPAEDARAQQMQQMREEAEKRMQEMRDRARQRAGGSTTPSPPATPPTANITGMRTWSDSTGRFTLVAELIAVQDGNVRLQRPDGKIVTMPIDKLSPGDRDAVRAKYPGQ